MKKENTLLFAYVLLLALLLSSCKTDLGLGTKKNDEDDPGSKIHGFENLIEESETPETKEDTEDNKEESAAQEGQAETEAEDIDLSEDNNAAEKEPYSEDIAPEEKTDSNDKPAENEISEEAESEEQPETQILQDSENSDGSQEEKTENKISLAYAAYIMQINKNLSTDTAIYIAEEAQNYAAERDYLDTETILAIARVESGFRPDISGDMMGLMQVSLKYALRSGYTENQLLDAHYNLEYALSILDSNYEKLDNNLTYALLAYNQGYYAFKSKLDSGEEFSTAFADKVFSYAENIREYVKNYY